MYSTEGYQAARHGSVVVRRDDRGVLSVSGQDRLAWLQGLLTNDVEKLQPGDSCYAAYLTPQGRMISDMRVINREDRTLLEVPGVLAESLCAKLDSLLFTEDAQIADLSGSVAVIDVIGPAASLPPGAAGAAIATAVDSMYGVPSVTMFVDVADAGGVLAAAVDAGAISTTLETLDVLRIEAGVPLFLVDMDEHTIPLEAGIEGRAVSFTKGCYVGQEVIVRVVQRGHGRVAKKLVGLRFEAGASPHAGDILRRDEREVGRITSAAWSPSLHRPIALAYVHRDFLQPGTTMLAHAADGAALIPATVVTLPFVGAQAEPFTR
jgi:tRNA-modifying protein YgfZ